MHPEGVLNSREHPFQGYRFTDIALEDFGPLGGGLLESRTNSKVTRRQSLSFSLTEAEV